MVHRSPIPRQRQQAARLPGQRVDMLRSAPRACVDGLDSYIAHIGKLQREEAANVAQIVEAVNDGALVAESVCARHLIFS